MNELQVWIQGVGLLGPGLDGWAHARDAWQRREPHLMRATLLPTPARLPGAERRRAGAAVKLALALADEAVAQAHIDPGALATVFTSSSGEGTNCHLLCETLATPAPAVSPTRFANSVHNAPAGCWHIAVASRASSTSLCAFDGSFSAGLLEAATSVVLTRQPVLLVASDSPYPEPLHATRPLPDHFGIALVLAAAPDAQSLAALTIAVRGPSRSAGGAANGSGQRGNTAPAQDPSARPDIPHPTATTCADDAGLEALRRSIPAARGLPLLRALARCQAEPAIVLDDLPRSCLEVGVFPIAAVPELAALAQPHPRQRALVPPQPEAPSLSLSQSQSQL